LISRRICGSSSATRILSGSEPTSSGFAGTFGDGLAASRDAAGAGGALPARVSAAVAVGAAPGAESVGAGIAQHAAQLVETRVARPDSLEVGLPQRPHPQLSRRRGEDVRQCAASIAARWTHPPA
jgi:hypothetical protein